MLIFSQNKKCERIKNHIYLSCYNTLIPFLCYYKHRLVLGVPWGTYR
uniref:Uncharacterized protein n=1 Tax=Anguilla anguilla TaxID=7936 RepID=A0A0E9WA29_ANGAN